MTRATRITGSVLCAVLVAALGGCGGGGDDAANPPAVAPPAAGAGTDASIEIKNFTYAPATTMIKLGESITVTNQDSAVHTLTVPDGVDSGKLAKGKSFTFTPKSAGELDYICDIHQYMKGKIVVS